MARFMGFVQGHRILTRRYKGFLVMQDGMEVVFVKVRVDDGKMPSKEHVKRKVFEDVCASWLAEHPEYVDREIRCDSVALHVVAGDRAFCRHIVNAPLV